MRCTCKPNTVAREKAAGTETLNNPINMSNGRTQNHLNKMGKQRFDKPELNTRGCGDIEALLMKGEHESNRITHKNRHKLWDEIVTSCGGRNTHKLWDEIVTSRGGGGGAQYTQAVERTRHKLWDEIVTSRGGPIHTSCGTN